jgi:DNA-binding Xre family transcriptional regulator/ribosomal protein L32
MLIEKDISPAMLRKDLNSAPGTMTTLRRNEEVALSVLLRICEYLDCNIGDICDAVKAKLNNECVPYISRFKIRLRTIRDKREDIHMAYCSKCGNQIPDNTKFCSECGAPTTSATASDSERKQEYAGKVINAQIVEQYFLLLK